MCGSRHLMVTTDWIALVTQRLLAMGATSVVSGGCRGADQIGTAAALDLRIPVDEFPAEWKEHGSKAGPMRNQAMAEFADAVLALPGGTGTADMIRKAKALGLPVERLV